MKQETQTPTDQPGHTTPKQPEPSLPSAAKKHHGFGHFIWGSMWRRIVTSVLVLAILVGLGGLTVFEVRHGGHDNQNSLANPNSVSASVSNACTTTNPPFSNFPIALSGISTVTPLGHLDPPSHNFPVPHMYINYAKQPNGDPVPVTFTAPGNINVYDISIIAKVNDTNTGKTYYDYKIWFTACDKLLGGYFIHVYGLSSQLAAAFGPLDANQITSNVMGHESWGPGIDVEDVNYTKFVNVNLNAGAEIGTAGGAANFTTNFDFGLSDSRKVGQTADPAIWKPNDDNYVCSLDYFSASVRKALYGKIGDFNNLSPAADQQCGQVYQDQDGTAQGVWVVKGTNKTNQSVWSLNQHLISFIHDNIVPHNYMVGFSSDVQQTLGFQDSSAYIVTPSSSGNVDRPFNDVVANGSTYCYQTTPQYSSPGQSGISFTLQMLNPTELRMGALPNGVSCSSPSSQWQPAKYLDFER
ncbi:MAG TPA: hypothetical protein VGS28_03075 [Candidatus Saccharimonadales bacterium]|nr:hypothetical protein [Candidatus Saccharimonadales bacterium]